MRSSCGEITVYPGGLRMALRCRCENGVIVDTFASGTPCPKDVHDDEDDERAA